MKVIGNGTERESLRDIGKKEYVRSEELRENLDFLR
jgi:hypothetical protein